MSSVVHWLVFWLWLASHSSLVSRSTLDALVPSEKSLAFSCTRCSPPGLNVDGANSINSIITHMSISWDMVPPADTMSTFNSLTDVYVALHDALERHVVDFDGLLTDGAWLGPLLVGTFRGDLQLDVAIVRIVAQLLLDVSHILAFRGGGRGMTSPHSSLLFPKTLTCVWLLHLALWLTDLTCSAL